MIKLYNYELSGNCYKLRLLMSMLKLPYDAIAVDFYPGREHKSKRFLALNPFGQLPVLEDGALRLRDAQAILVYLATQYDAKRTWYPDDPAAMGQITMWLAVADEITRTASAARLHDALGYVLDIAKARADAHALFRIIDDHLADKEVIGQHWLAMNQATIADIACFPYIAMSHEGNIMRDDYPAIRRWIERVRRLPGFVGMSGIFAPTL
ncbi:glutathione S-transferase [Herminiimonas sp. KBW02]|uniref:glutathione S-transferase family protein n=1 Tax=Herminiimonas sp. KBW02 TaxID=2153363 RepID=UPI000F5AB35C|nr:glutathione S-transferase [Herminiimonas sp. KBW02]RQO36416.1 glutathione S-transferase [Herminiimonas sp. KBW02]